ncbi:MAG: RNase adapter RapZ [Myxococcota bacterium]
MSGGPDDPHLHIVIITGMSGAGRSTALHVLEDLGFFCVDNLPPPLAAPLVQMLGQGEELGRLGFGMDVRTGAFLEGAGDVVDGLDRSGHRVEVLFLDCADEALVRRFSETRRPHPLAAGGDVLDAIQRERERLGPLRARANQVVDTTHRSVHDLRRMLIDYVARDEGRQRMVTRIVSFGFKYGLPVDADLVFDLRYLPNPHFVAHLEPRTGTDPEVARFVLDAPETGELLDDLVPLLQHAMPRYEREGKAYLTIALGCTGGRHRSVAVAEELGRRIGPDREVHVTHRDAARGGVG